MEGNNSENKVLKKYEQEVQNGNYPSTFWSYSKYNIKNKYCNFWWGNYF